MAQALITVNGVTGSNADLPINTLVQLNNVNSGGETTYTWSIVDQPSGTAVVLSSTTIQNPTFTPTKEGSYLIKLVVNQGLPSESVNSVICAVLQLKTRLRIPAAGETTEASLSRGWAASANQDLQALDSLKADPGLVVGTAGAAGLVPGNVVRVSSVTVIKSGLPGQETVPTFTKALATTAGHLDELLGVVVSGVNGSLTPASGDLIYVRTKGLYLAASGAGSSLGNPVYVSDTGTLSLSAGTNSRVIGSVVTAGVSTFDVWVSGDLTSAVTSVSAGTGITVSGTTTPSVSITNTGVSANSYAFPSSVTVNSQGQITAITAGSAAASYSADVADGADGAVTISINTTLSRPMRYSSLTVNNGVTLNAANWPIQCSGTITNNGTISCQGASASGQSGGSAATDTCFVLTGSGGANGGSGSNGSSASTSQRALGGSGGIGGTASSNSPGAAGTSAAFTASHGPIITADNLRRGGQLSAANGSIQLFTAGRAGGGGAAAPASVAGGGGAGGGYLLIIATEIVNNGTISANGGNGGNAVSGASAGGGGAGGGGLVAIFTPSFSGNTPVATAGTPGTGIGTGGTGGTGNPGLVYLKVG